MNKMLIFHHSDLDGMGVKIVGIKAAEQLGYEYETFKCNYNDVNEIVKNRINKDLSEVKMIVIADISVDAETAVLLDSTCKDLGISLVLRDHHATAEHLNKYEWAFVAERQDGIPYCGTWLLAQKFSEVTVDPTMQTFIRMVDDWDTWKWTTNGNENAKKLNALFQVVGEDKFTDYILSLDAGIAECSELFTVWAESMVEAHSLLVKKAAKNCESSMWTTTLKVNSYSYSVGIVFCNSDTSDISNCILERHPELDILMLVGFPRSVSFRTQKQLEVPLGDIAKAMTGSGGGHPQSAGCVISQSQFSAAFTYFLHNTSRGKLYFSPLELSKED